MCSIVSNLSNVIPAELPLRRAPSLQSSKYLVALREDMSFKPFYASTPKAVPEIDCSAGVLPEVPRNDGSGPSLKLGSQFCYNVTDEDSYLSFSRPKAEPEIDRSAGARVADFLIRMRDKLCTSELSDLSRHDPGLEEPLMATDAGSYRFLKFGESGSAEGFVDGSAEGFVELKIQNAAEYYYDRPGRLFDSYYSVFCPERLKEFEFSNGYDRYRHPMLAGLKPHRTKNGFLVRAAASPIGILQLGWDIQMVANGGSKLVNVDSIYRAFDSYITPHVRFRMASSSPKENNFNFFSHNNININGSQHIGLENPSGPTTEAGSGEDGGNGRLPPSGRSRGGGGKDNDHGDVYDGQFPWIPKAVAEMMKEVPAGATKAEKAEAAKKSMGTLEELISRLALLVVSCLIFGTPILADPSLLFKVCIATQVVTGSCFSTFAGLLRGVLATCACMGVMPTASGGFFGHVQRAYSSLPSSTLKGGSPGFNISLKPCVLTYFNEGILFGTAGLGCGLICHAVFNLIRAGNGNAEESEEENLVSFIVKNAVRLGVFLLFAWIPVIRLLKVN